MDRFKRYAKVIAAGVTGVFASATTALAVPIFTLDSAQAIEDVTAAGTAILAVAIVMYGIGKIRQIVGA